MHYPLLQAIIKGIKLWNSLWKSENKSLIYKCEGGMGNERAKISILQCLLAMLSTGHPFPFGHQDLSKGSCVYICGVVRTATGPLQREKSAFITKTEDIAWNYMKFYCQRENSATGKTNCYRQGLFLYLFISVTHTEVLKSTFLMRIWGYVLFKQVDTSRDVKGLCQRIMLLLCLLCLCHVYVKLLISENSQNFVNRLLAKSRL